MKITLDGGELYAGELEAAFGFATGFPSGGLCWVSAYGDDAVWRVSALLPDTSATRLQQAIVDPFVWLVDMASGGRHSDGRSDWVSIERR